MVLDKNRSGDYMKITLDIFKRLPDGHPLWVKAVDGLEEARAQLVRLAASAPGEYFVYSVQHGRVVLPTNFAAGLCSAANWSRALLVCLKVCLKLNRRWAQSNCLLSGYGLSRHFRRARTVAEAGLSTPKHLHRCRPRRWFYFERSPRGWRLPDRGQLHSAWITDFNFRGGREQAPVFGQAPVLGGCVGGDLTRREYLYLFESTIRSFL